LEEKISTSWTWIILMIYIHKCFDYVLMSKKEFVECHDGIDIFNDIKGIA